jgi:Tol biopolymer transport system component
MVGCANLTLPVDDGSPPDVTRPELPPPAPPASLPQRNPFIPAPGAISIADAQGTEMRFLVPGSWPSWSPDGRSIAFQREESVWVIGVDGANERMIGPGSEPAWSPDGLTMAFSSARGIEVMTLDGKGRRVLLSREDPFDGSSPWPLGLRKPAWSPDGSRIAFERDGDGDLVFSHVYVANADGTAPRRVTTETDFFSQ